MKRGLVACLAIAMATPPLTASDPTLDLADIAYQDRGWAESELRSRGYSLHHSDQHAGSLFQYWWNPGRHACVQVRYDGYKVGEVNSTSSTDCGQYHDDTTKDDQNAALAIGAVALIAGIAALSHKSHHRDGEHGEDEQSVADFERGYRDGLHREDYHNYNDTQAYSDGYSAGVDERQEETSYRSRQSSHSGYQPFVSLDDLVGARASSADSELRSRGFSDTGGYKRKGRSMVTWWNERTRQCVEVTTAQGHVASIESQIEGTCN
jgi:hypothetical protein